MFISQTEVSAAFPRIDRLHALAAEQGMEVVLDRVFASRNGVPAYYVFRIDTSAATTVGQGVSGQ